MPKIRVTVCRGTEQLEDELDHEKIAERWTALDVWLVLAKMHWLIADTGNRRVPANFAQTGDSTVLEIESEDGEARVTCSVEGIAPTIIEEAQSRGI